MQRNHKEEKQVKEFMSLPMKDGKRSLIIKQLRNEGAFQMYLLNNHKVEEEVNYPCPFCKIILSKNYLRRHTKLCKLRKLNESETLENPYQSLAASQTLVAMASNTSKTISKLNIRNEVFSIMRPDDITYIVKTDPLIALYGEVYLKKHNKKQMRHPCSNEMRELARLLMQIRYRLQISDCSLADILVPENFDTIVISAKVVGGFNEVDKTFKAPSVSMHLGTSLKKVCDILYAELLKKNGDFLSEHDEAKIQNVERLKQLIVSQWTNEVAGLALKDLNEKKWNKPVVLPLTKDILKFKDYVFAKPVGAQKTLADSKNNRCI
ncbi:hypothetical protein MML48_4g00004246 [Holotrichia oblita]|uniref:Uncharacterized protein n=1 Tax=Holotrichia oblita TaxID=644536 RepID=A0ACB9T8S0_HOLOL|nr:hypothetical protein MML48_4g00004246 [Holotrichia oblita]